MNKMTEPDYHIGECIRVADDIETTIISLRWDGCYWTYQCSY